MNRLAGLVVVVVMTWSTFPRAALAEQSQPPRPLRPLTSLAFLQNDDPPPRDPLPSSLPESPAVRSPPSAAQQPGRARELDDTPAYKRWWFWVLTGVVIGGTVALGVWAAQPTTQPARSCMVGVMPCFGDGRPR